MPRVSISTARKDYPDAGIRRGDTYYSWAFFRGPVQRSKTYPRPSQLCNNKFSGALAAMEALDDAIGDATTPEDITSAIEDAVSSLNDVVSEYEDAISNLESAFPGGSPQLDEHNEKKDAIETCVSDLESASTEVEGLDAAEYKDDEEQREMEKPAVNEFGDLGPLGKSAMMDAAREIAQGVSLDS